MSIAAGDLHPHVMNLGFLVLAIACALMLLQFPAESPRQLTHALRCAAIGVVVGASGFMNTWDLPAALGVVIATLALRVWLDGGREDALWQGAIVGLVAILAYAPFYASLDREASGVFAVIQDPTVPYPGTRPLNLFLHWGPLFGLVLPFSCFLIYEGRTRLNVARIVIGMAVPVSVVLAWLVVFLGEQASNSARLDGAGGLTDQITSRGANWASAGIVALVIASAFTALLVQDRGTTDHRARVSAFVLLLIAIGALLIFISEFFYAEEALQIRLVSLFKLTYISWTFLAVAASVALRDLICRFRIRLDPTLLLWGAVATPLLAAGFLLPVGAFPNRIHPDVPSSHILSEPHTLNAIAGYSEDERAAVMWLRERAVEQRFVLAETVILSDGRSDYTSAGRLSTASGMPTVLAWPDHEAQWRGTTEPLGTRREDIARLYRSASLVTIEEILRRYDIDFLAVGSLEISTYSAASLAKFTAYPVAFQQGEITIYDVSAVTSQNRAR